MLRTIELRIGVRENGVFYVFGRTAMFFYLVHRLALETPATYFGFRDFDGLGVTSRWLLPWCRCCGCCRGAGAAVPDVPLVSHGEGGVPALALEVPVVLPC